MLKKLKYLKFSIFFICLINITLFINASSNSNKAPHEEYFAFDDKIPQEVITLIIKYTLSDEELITKLLKIESPIYFSAEKYLSEPFAVLRLGYAKYTDDEINKAHRDLMLKFSPDNSHYSFSKIYTTIALVINEARDQIKRKQEEEVRLDEVKIYARDLRYFGYYDGHEEEISRRLNIPYLVDNNSLKYAFYALGLPPFGHPKNIINSAFRKRYRSFHPDKNLGEKIELYYSICLILNSAKEKIYQARGW